MENSLKFTQSVAWKHVNNVILKVFIKARSGEIKEFTGISAPYEAPHQPEITINTEHQSVEESVNTIIEYLKNKQYI